MSYLTSAMIFIFIACAFSLGFLAAAYFRTGRK